MTEMGKNRRFIAIVAVALVLFGLIMVGGASPITPSAPVAKGSTPPAAEENKDQASTYFIRDYPKLAADESTDVPSDWIGTLGSFAVKLIFVVILAYGALWALKRYAFKGTATGVSGKGITLLSSLDLSPNRTVYVIEVGKKGLVIGATQTQISLLSEITDAEGLDELRASATRSVPEVPFLSLLERSKSRRAASEEPPTQTEETIDDLSAKLMEGRLFLQTKLDSMRQLTGGR